MGNRRLDPPVLQLDPAGLAQYGLDNYGLDLDPAAGRDALVAAIQDAKAAIPDGQDPVNTPEANTVPPAAPDQSPPPAQLARMNAPDPNAPGPQPLEGVAPEPGRNFDPGPSRPAPEAPRPKFEPGPPASRGRIGDSDPVQDFASQRERVDIPEGYEMPDFDDDNPADPMDKLFDANRQQLNPEDLRQGPAKKAFRHPRGTKWLYNPLTDVFWKPTETLMQNKELIPVMGDPPAGSAIGTA